MYLRALCVRAKDIFFYIGSQDVLDSISKVHHVSWGFFHNVTTTNNSFFSLRWDFFP